MFQRDRPYCVGIDGKVITNKKRFGKFSGLFYDTIIMETAIKQVFILTHYIIRRLSLHQSTEIHKQETKWTRNTEIRVYETRSELPEVLPCTSQTEIPVNS